MNFTQFLLILRARKKIILGTIFLTVATALTVCLVLPKNYKATTSLVLNYKGVDPVTGMTLPAQLMPGYMPTQVDIITSKTVAVKVIDDLKLASIPAVQEQFKDDADGVGDIRNWLADLLLKKLDVVPARESSVLDISFKGTNPQFAATVANAFANAYLQTSVRLKVEPLQKASGYFNVQIKSLRDNLEAAQNKLSKYQQEKGIVNIDNRVDVESARLNDLSSQLVIAQGNLMEALSRKKQAGLSASDSPDVLTNPVIFNLKLSLASAESKFSDAAQKLGKNHPTYMGAKAEVDKLRSELNEQIKIASSGIGNNAQILQQRESEIRAAFNAQKAKVLELNRARDELSVLGKEVENAQRAYDVTNQRVNQTNLEGQSNQSDVAILSPAVPPLEAHSPKMILIMPLSVLIGIIMGLAFGLLAEMVDRRVRSTSDLVEVLQAPVLGVIEWAAPKRRRFGIPKLRFTRKLSAN